MSSFEDISSMFAAESEKLKTLINNTTIKDELSIHEIIETYYQIMNVSSMATMLKQQIDTEQKPLLDKIHEIEEMVSEKFNPEIHPKILDQLGNSIQETTKNLQSSKTREKSKDDVENEAKLYEELRQKMSTKEFVEQYDTGLSND